MGLLELAQIQKQQQDEGASLPILNEEIEEIQGSGLLAMAKRSKMQATTQNDSKKTGSELLKKFHEPHVVIEEKRGFGYKGMGARKIIQLKKTNEYLYQVIEPILNEQEIEIKKELSHLFKMLADINIAVESEGQRKKYLEQTLDQIVKDNDIKFYPVEKKPEKKSFSFNDLFSLKKDKDEKSMKQRSVQKTNPFDRVLKQFNKKEREEEKKRLERMAAESKKKIYYHLFREFVGYHRMDVIMKDEGIEDISCDGPEVPIFLYHKKYEEITTNVQFETPEELDSFVVRLAQISGKQISIFSPIVDGKLPDGSRLQATLAKTVTRGSTYTIRRFKANPLTPVDLINYQSLSLDMAAYFWLAIENASSILFCGGTASGKTTALNALSLFIPSSHKVITIEDTREISLPHKNWIAGTTRQGFSASDDKTGKDIDMFDLIRAALRQRPKVIMVGEVRGKEAYSLFQAMATGHTSYSTVHASDIHTLIQRLENPPIGLPRALLTSLDIIVFQNAIDIGKKSVRRMTSVTEVIKLDPETNQLIFMEPFRWISKTDDRFEMGGGSKILNSIRIQNNWEEEDLEEELENRKTILKWMIQKDKRDYREVGRIVAEYEQNPTDLLLKAKEELNQ
jgi:archaeal flagellar protein FlaI